MSRLKKKILWRDFDEFSSDDDPKRKMVQQLMVLKVHRLEGQQFEDLRMQKNSLFLRILNTIQQHDDYFILKHDVVNIPGLSGLQKMNAAMRILAYGVPANAVDEYVSIDESTTLKSLKRFCRAVVHVYEEEDLRSPNEADIFRLLEIAERREFPGHQYTMGYYLVDGIYPQWDTIVQKFNETTINLNNNNKKTLISKMQEAYQKDVEGTFGVLQKHDYRENLVYIIKTCIILHSMIIEDEHTEDIPDVSHDLPEDVHEVSHDLTPIFTQFLTDKS